MNKKKQLTPLNVLIKRQNEEEQDTSERIKGGKYYVRKSLSSLIKLVYSDDYDDSNLIVLKIKKPDRTGL